MGSINITPRTKKNNHKSKGNSIKYVIRHSPAELGGHHGGGGEVVYDDAALGVARRDELANLSVIKYVFDGLVEEK